MNASHTQPRGKIGVVCAPTPGINPGMTSVDLAFHAVARRHGFDDVTYFQLFDGAKYSDIFPNANLYRDNYFRDFPLRYTPLLDNREALLACDAIVYWGDWTHMAMYCHSIMAPSLTMLKIAADDSAAHDLIGRYFFLADQPPSVLQKAVSFGETLIFNSPRDELDIYEALDARRFFHGLKNVYMRDIVSANKIRQLTGHFDRAFLGVDCAMLLTVADHEWMPRQIAAPIAPRNDLLVYFGRSDYPDEQLHELVEAIALRTDLLPQWLDWGNAFAFPQARQPLFPVAGQPLQDMRIGDQMRLIENSALVITDTYHLCVNAWRMGVPAICLGSLPARSSFDLNCGHGHAACDKRFILYTMIDALDFFIPTHELDDGELLAARIAHVANRFRDRAVIERIVSGIRLSAYAAERALVDDLNNVLLQKPARRAGGESMDAAECLQT